MAFEPLLAQARSAKNLKKMLPIVRYCQLSMSAVILIAVDILSNTNESEKTNKLIDEPENVAALHLSPSWVSLRP